MNEFARISRMVTLAGRRPAHNPRVASDGFGIATATGEIGMTL
jgi:hypothetical protein